MRQQLLARFSIPETPHQPCQRQLRVLLSVIAADRRTGIAVGAEAALAAGAIVLGAAGIFGAKWALMLGCQQWTSLRGEVPSYEIYNADRILRRIIDQGIQFDINAISLSCAYPPKDFMSPP